MAFDFSGFLQSLGHNFAQNAGGGDGAGSFAPGGAGGMGQPMPFDQKLLNVASILQGNGMPKPQQQPSQGQPGQPDMDALRRMIMSLGGQGAQPPPGVPQAPNFAPGIPMPGQPPQGSGFSFGFGGR